MCLLFPHQHQRRQRPDRLRLRCYCAPGVQGGDAELQQRRLWCVYDREYVEWTVWAWAGVPDAKCCYWRVDTFPLPYSLSNCLANSSNFPKDKSSTPPTKTPNSSTASLCPQTRATTRNRSLKTSMLLLLRRFRGEHKAGNFLVMEREALSYNDQDFGHLDIKA